MDHLHKLVTGNVHIESLAHIIHHSTKISRVSARSDEQRSLNTTLGFLHHSVSHLIYLIQHRTNSFTQESCTTGKE